MSAPTRMLGAWRKLPQERRLAVMACLGLFLTLFLPWYQETVFANGVTSLRSASSSLTGWGAFSFVEAAVLLVAAAVLILLFARAEGQAFHVPGGDGGVITAAGFWTCLLIVWRIFDKEGTSRHDQIAYTSGIEWGIFVALGVAAVLTYAGSQIRLAHEPEAPLPGERSPQRPRRTRRRGWLRGGSEDAGRRAPARRAHPGPDMGAEDDWTQELRAGRVAAPPSEAPARPDATEAPTERVRPRTIAPDAAADRAAAVSTRPRRPLDRREIQELDIAEPPTARLSRSAPAVPRRPGPVADTEPSRPEHVEPEPSGPEHVEPEPSGPEHVEPEHVEPEHVQPDPAEAETQRRPAPPDPSDDQLTIRLERPT